MGNIRSFGYAKDGDDLSPEATLYRVLEDMHSGEICPESLIVIAAEEGEKTTRTVSYTSAASFERVVAMCEVAKHISMDRLS